uniref:Uncharacterized protein n=1 Tax=Geladintestivirus 1 TaxID=3233133 RepID=A0AAU8MI59_9CAUD
MKIIEKEYYKEIIAEQGSVITNWKKEDTKFNYAIKMIVDKNFDSSSYYDMEKDIALKLEKEYKENIKNKEPETIVEKDNEKVLTNSNINIKIEN